MDIFTHIVSSKQLGYTYAMNNNEHAFTRIEWLIGPAALSALKRSRVAVFGVGGVGACAAEALARSGVGAFTLVDHDTIALSNLNRQLHALHSTLGRRKAEVLRERILDINPQAEIAVLPLFYTEASESAIDWDFDYVIDAVDTVTAKMGIILAAKRHGIPVISSMGAGNKLNPSLFQASDIYATRVCPLAKIMRRLCRQQGVDALKTVYSTEQPRELYAVPSGERKTVSSAMFATSAAGLLIAAEVVNDLLNICMT